MSLITSCIGEFRKVKSSIRWPYVLQSTLFFYPDTCLGEQVFPTLLSRVWIQGNWHLPQFLSQFPFIGTVLVKALEPGAAGGKLVQVTHKVLTQRQKDRRIHPGKKKKKVLSTFFLPFFTCLNHTPPWAPRSFSKTSGFSTSSDNSLPPEGFGSHLLAVWPGTNCLTSLNCVVRASKKGNDKSN